MFKTKLSRLLAGIALAVGSLSSAHAITISAGDYKMIFDNYDSGTTYLTPDPVTGAPTFINGVNCGALGGGGLAVASCDAAAALFGSQAPGSVGSVNTSSDTMGIISVASVTRISDGTVIFTRGLAGQSVNGVAVGPFLTGVFGNLTDFYAETTGCLTTGCQTTALASGGTFRLWSNPTDYDVSIGPTVSANVDLNDLKYTPSVSAGTLFLGGNFVTGAISTLNAAASYVSTFSPDKLVGGGSGFLDFTEGAALAIFNTNSLLTNNASGTQFADAKLTDTYRPDPQAPQWSVISSGDVTGAVIPEPGSLVLVSLGLLAFGVSANRRRPAKG